LNKFEFAELELDPYARHKGAMKASMYEWGNFMINFISRRNHLLSQAPRIVDVCQDTERAAPCHYSFGQALTMLSEDDILGIIAKFTAEQVDPTHIRGRLLDADPYGNVLSR
jgi:hypothetical protein